MILCYIITAAQTLVICVTFADDANKAAVNLIVRREERAEERQQRRERCLTRQRLSVNLPDKKGETVRSREGEQMNE